MNKQTVAFWRRDFSSQLAELPVDYRTGSYSRSVIGGPKKAQITATGKELDLWELLEYLRCPVNIISEKGDAVWWGFVAEIKLEVGRWAVGINIDTMANYLGVIYEDDTDNGSPKKTSWAEAADSIAEYGRKELLMTSSGSNETFALAARDKYLAEKKNPQPVITKRDKGKDKATIYCRGWIDTLAWRYYTNIGTDQVDTATQISDIETGCGEFITATDLETTSGISTAETRDGNATAFFEINELLKMGTSNYRRLLCEVLPGRNLRVYEEPTIPTQINQILKNGDLVDPFDELIRKETCPMGMWARLKDVIPGSVDTTKMADPTIIFIDETEYDPDRDWLDPKPRGFVDPFSIGRPRDG